jgi:hypothetical protein
VGTGSVVAAIDVEGGVDVDVTGCEGGGSVVVSAAGRVFPTNVAAVGAAGVDRSPVSSGEYDRDAIAITPPRLATTASATTPKRNAANRPFDRRRFTSGGRLVGASGSIGRATGASGGADGAP